MALSLNQPASIRMLLLLAFLGLGQSTFTTQPMSVRQAEGLEAVFECLYPIEALYHWLINGVSQQIFPDLKAVLPSGGSPSSLTIPAIPQYNNSIVQCEAVLREGGGFEGVLSENATLLVQGPLQSVSNHQLNDSMSCTSLNISWDAPFSLNLTDVEPDIQYCIDVYNVTEGGDNLVDSICDITDTFYLYNVHAERSCGRFNITVTPRSNVPGAPNGTRSEPVQYSYAPSEIPIDQALFITNIDLTPVKVTFPAEVLGSCRRRMPTNFSVHVQYIDNLEDEPSCDCPTSFTINNTVELTVHCNIDCPLERHRRCNMSIIAENRAGRTNSDMAMRISTHDVQNVNANMSQQGELDVSCTYLKGSKDPGFFTIIYSLVNTSDITYRVARRNDFEAMTTLAIPNLQSSVYKLAVYDLNDDSIPEENTAAQPDVKNVDTTQFPGTNQQIPTSVLQLPPEVTFSNRKICIDCSFSDTKAIGCVGVIHSAQLDNLTLTILPVERSVGMNCTEETFNEGEYFVAVFGQLEIDLEESPAYVTIVSVESSPSTTPVFPPLDNPPNLPGIIAGVLIPVMITSIIIAIVVFVVWRNKKTKKIHISTEVDLQNYSLSDHSPGYESVTGILYTESTIAPAGDPPPPRCDDLPTVRRDPGYEDVELIQTWNRPVVVPSFSVARDVLISRPVSIVIDEDAPPLPPPCKPEDIISSSQVKLVQHGTGSVVTLPGVEEPHSQNKPMPETVTSVNKTDLSGAHFADPEDSLTRLLNQFSSTNSDESNGGDLPMQESYDLNKEEFVAQEPAYDVAKTIMVKQSTTSGPLPDDTVTEHQYSEVGGAISDSEEGLHYAHVTPKSKGLSNPSDDPTTVVYSTLNENKLVRRSEESEVQQEQAPPTPPRRPTADMVLYMLDSVAKRWVDLGEALEIDDDLDRFSCEGHPKVSLHDMIHYYFSSYQFKHTWEEIVQALEKIGETETADKIVRTYNVTIESGEESGEESPPVPSRSPVIMSKETTDVDSTSVGVMGGEIQAPNKKNYVLSTEDKAHSTESNLEPDDDEDTTSHEEDRDDDNGHFDGRYSSCNRMPNQGQLLFHEEFEPAMPVELTKSGALSTVDNVDYPQDSKTTTTCEDQESLMEGGYHQLMSKQLCMHSILKRPVYEETCKENNSFVRDDEGYVSESNDRNNHWSEQLVTGKESSSLLIASTNDPRGQGGEVVTIGKKSLGSVSVKDLQASIDHLRCLLMKKVSVHSDTSYLVEIADHEVPTVVQEESTDQECVSQLVCDLMLGSGEERSLPETKDTCTELSDTRLPQGVKPGGPHPVFEGCLPHIFTGRGLQLQKLGLIFQPLSHSG